MKHTYDMIGYAKQLQNDLKEFNEVDVTLDEIIKEHDLKPDLLYTTNNELVLLETKEREKRKMKKINELRDYLLQNYVDENGNLDISKLDFSDFKGYVDIGNMKVQGNLFQSWHDVKGNLHQSNHDIDGNLYQDEHKVGGDLYQNQHKVGGHLIQTNHEVNGDLIQNNHEVKGDLFQSWHNVEGDLYQTEHKVTGDLIQSYHEVDGDLYQEGHDIKGSLIQGEHEVGGNLYQGLHDVKGNYYSTNINVTGKINFEAPKKTLKEITAEELEKMGYKIKEEVKCTKK